LKKESSAVEKRVLKRERTSPGGGMLVGGEVRVDSVVEEVRGGGMERLPVCWCCVFDVEVFDCG
jgi:hypothetical protein